jgi:uncharacterized protein YdeI (YjbR/CyaY-like superfamily)
VQIIRCLDASEWESWLAAHHTLREGVWLKMAKRGSGLPSVTHLEAVEVALCYGWIDSLRRSLDGTFFLQRFSPRRQRSAWSRVNVERAEALIASGRMRPPGLAQIEAAKADGRWDAAVVAARGTSAGSAGVA